MDNILGTIQRLDAAEDHQGMLEFARQEGVDVNQLIFAAYQLLAARRFKGAYILGKIILATGTVHPVVALTQSVGGVIFNNLDDQSAGNDLLRRGVDQLPAEQQSIIYTEIISRLIPDLVNHSFLNNDNETLIRLLEIVKAGVPSFRPIFDLAEAPKPLDLDEMKRRGRERAQLISLDGPPAGAPRGKHRAVVAVREYFLGAITDTKRSRLCEIGPRIAAAFTAYGWPSQFYGMRFLNPDEDYRGIAEMCRATGADVLVLDDNLIQNLPARKARAETIAQLRQDIPALKVISAYFDPWMIAPEDLIEASAIVDVVWAPGPSLPVWKHPTLAGKTSMAIYPLGVELPQVPTSPKPPRMTFTGSVMGNNWHRAFWLGATARENLPIDHQISSHKPDGLSAMESYKVYLTRLADARYSLNFTMRNDLQRILTSRTTETILSGALLIEEWSPDVGYYLVAGDHYLDFTTFAELRSIAKFIESEPERADEIRRNGAAFVRDRYSDHRVVGNLEKLLYFPETKPEAPAVSVTTSASSSSAPVAAPTAPVAAQPAPASRFIGSMIGMDIRVKVVDIGANPINGPAPYESLLRAKSAEVVGFEPNLEALNELLKIKGPDETYLPHAVGDGQRHTLNFCQAPGMTSLLVPNPKVLGLFHGFPDWGRIMSTEKIDTVRLDDVPETAGVDLLKMDIQGAELMVLRHAEDRLRDTLVLQTEVEFLQMYVDQPLFSDIDIFMRERGFVFHRFFPTVSRVIKPLVVDNSIYAGMSQLLWADAVFVRDFTKLELFTDKQLVSTAAIVYECYQSIDLALHLLNEYDRRQKTQLGVKFLTALRGG